MNLELLKPIAEALPDTVKANALALLEEMSAVVEGIGDEPVVWKPPFLRMVQSTTDRSALPKGVGIGDFIIGESKTIQPLPLIPLRLWDARQYWDPDQNVNKMLCNSPDAKLGYIGAYCKTCQFAEWIEGEGSACNKMKAMLAITSDLRTLFSINFAKTSYKPGMEFEAAMKKAGVTPYRRMYELSTTQHATAKNVEVYKVGLPSENAKRITPDPYLDFLKGLFDIINQDRKVMLDKFYEGAMKKHGVMAIANASSQADTTLTIENGSEGTPASEPTVETSSEAPTESKKSLAKKYTV